jgi:hypothetical protein
MMVISGDFDTRIAGFWFSELMASCIIWKGNIVAFTSDGFGFDEFKSAR